jgi:hypothetical protein
VEYFQRVLKIVVQTGNDVIQASANYAQDQAQQGGVPDVFWIISSPLGLVLRQENRNDCGCHDNDPVPLDGDRADAESDSWTKHRDSSPLLIAAIVLLFVQANKPQHSNSAAP